MCVFHFESHQGKVGSNNKLGCKQICQLIIVSGEVLICGTYRGAVALGSWFYNHPTDVASWRVRVDEAANPSLHNQDQTSLLLHTAYGLHENLLEATKKSVEMYKFLWPKLYCFE